ncbi:response regulator, partial [Vibrio cholerae HC-50A2]
CTLLNVYVMMIRTPRCL